MTNLSKFYLKKGFKQVILFLLVLISIIYGIIGFDVFPVLMGLIAVWIIKFVLDLT